MLHVLNAGKDDEDLYGAARSSCPQPLALREAGRRTAPRTCLRRSDSKFPGPSGVVLRFGFSDQAIQFPSFHVGFDLGIPSLPILFQKPLAKFRELLSGKLLNLLLDFLAATSDRFRRRNEARTGRELSTLACMSTLTYDCAAMSPKDKPLVWLHGEVKSPPLSKEGRIEAGFLLRRLQRGESLGMPHSRPMPSMGHALPRAAHQ